MSLRALIFDVDGTLALTEELHRECYNLIFQEKGLDWDWSPELYDALLKVAGGIERLVYYVREYGKEEANRPDLEAFLKELHREKTALFNARLREGGVALRPGVERLIREARAEGLTLGIATSTSQINFEALALTTLGPDAPGWFSAIGSGECAPGRKKPFPDIYLWTLERLGLSPEECLAVEDASLGLRSALAAGVPTLVTCNHYTRNEDFTGALAVTDGLGEPDHPCEFLAGDPGDKSRVDLELLRRWFAK